MMTIYYAFCFFLFGTVLGSFYNVVGYRLPKGQSLLYPSSHCTNCNHKLMPWELVPIFSFLFLFLFNFLTAKEPNDPETNILKPKMA